MSSEKSIRDLIEEEKQSDPEFAKQYEEYRREYKLIAQLIGARKEKGLSQSELAESINMSQQVVSRIETLSHSPSLANFLKLVDGLGMELKLAPKDPIGEHFVPGVVRPKRSKSVTYGGALPASHKPLKAYEKNQAMQEK